MELVSSTAPITMACRRRPPSRSRRSASIRASSRSRVPGTGTVGTFVGTPTDRAPSVTIWSNRKSLISRDFGRNHHPWIALITRRSSVRIRPPLPPRPPEPHGFGGFSFRPATALWEHLLGPRPLGEQQDADPNGCQKPRAGLASFFSLVFCSAPGLCSEESPKSAFVRVRRRFVNRNRSPEIGSAWRSATTRP